MKKLLTLILALIMVFIAATPIAPVYAASKPITVTFIGSEKEISGLQPFIDSKGKVWATAQSIAYAIGVDKTAYDIKTLKETYTRNKNTLTLYAGKKEYAVNGIKKQMDSATIVKSGMIYVEPRYIAEAFGLKALWNPTDKIISIRKANMPKRVALASNSWGFEVDNDYCSLGKSPAMLPALIKNTLIIPIRPLADIFNGTYSFDSKSNTAILKIDGTSFEFKLLSDNVKINGVSRKMDTEARLDQGIVRVPAKVLLNNLKSYDVKFYGNMQMLIRLKGKTDFYDENGDIISSDKTTLKYYNEFNNEKLPKDVDDTANQIAAKLLKPGMSDYDKVLAVNRYIIENTTYVRSSEGLYDVLLKGKGICQGYACATANLLNKMGVEAKFVVGFAGVDGFKDIDEYELGNYKENRHAWNIVKVDGKYYHLDVTWNDATINDEETNRNMYDYLLLSDKQMQTDHIWRKTFYPPCSTNYDDKLINDSAAQGYTPVTGKIKFESGTAKEDIYILMSMENSGISMSRTLFLGKGSSESSFMLIPEKQYSSELQDHIGFQLADIYNYKTDDKYTLEVQQNGNDYTVIVKPEKTAASKIKVLFPQPAKMNQSLYIRVSTMTPQGKGFSSYGSDGVQLEITPGMTEATVTIKPPLPPQGECWYTLELIGNNIEKYMDGQYNLVDSYQRMSLAACPLDSITVKLPDGVLQTPVQSENLNVELNDSQISEIKTALAKYHVGDKKLESVKSTANAKALETSDPTEVDSNGTIYYVEYLKSGVQVYRSYNQHSDAKRLYYSISLNRIQVTQDNYIKLYNKLNGYLKELLKADKLTAPNVYTSGKGSTKLDSWNVKTLFTQMMKGYSQLEANYKKNNVNYQLYMGGNPSTEEVSVIFSITINK